MDGPKVRNTCVPQPSWSANPVVVGEKSRLRSMILVKTCYGLFTPTDSEFGPPFGVIFECCTSTACPSAVRFGGMNEISDISVFSAVDWIQSQAKPSPKPKARCDRIVSLPGHCSKRQ